MYEIPSGSLCIVTKGEDYSTRREFITRKALKFGRYLRRTRATYQFEHKGWLLVISAWNVRLSGKALADEKREAKR